MFFWFQGHSAYIGLNVPYSPWAGQELQWVGCVTGRAFTQAGGDVEPCTVSNMPYRGTQRIIFWGVSATVGVMIYYKNVCTYSALIPILLSYALLHFLPSALPTRMWFHSFKHFWFDSLCLIEYLSSSYFWLPLMSFILEDIIIYSYIHYFFRFYLYQVGRKI